MAARVSLYVLLFVGLTSGLAVAGQASTPTNGGEAPGAGDAVTMRSTDGRLQLTAFEAPTPPRLDGSLDDEVWQLGTPIGGFLQSEPQEGQPATEPTEVRVAYDRNNLYIAAKLYDSEPDRIVINDIRKDFTSGDQDSFEVILDTFGDRRNGFMFMTNPEGARSDQQVANEGRENNASWDAVWFVETTRDGEGWNVEMAIPFKSLRFEGGVDRVWGINFSRRIRRKNEVTYWSPVPRQFKLSRVSEAGNLVLPPLSAGRNLRIKPYLAASGVRDTGDTVFDGDFDIGVDLKYGITPALTLDVTGNPDFAQAEADEQQVNLTQFSQFFPEKRDFFLENSGIFYVGDAQRTNRTNPTPSPDEDLLLFFSRRIGLQPTGEPIPIAAGGRLTGQIGGMSVGALSIQTTDEGTTPNNHFAVLRLRKNLFTTSDVGGIFMTRQSTDSGDDYNRVYGLDANVRLFGAVDWSTYYVQSDTPGVEDKQFAFRSTYMYEGSKFWTKGGLMSIGENFRSDLSYYRRVGMRKWIYEMGVRPRPAALARRGIREMHIHFNNSYFTDQEGDKIARRDHMGYTFFFNNGGYTEISINPRADQLTRPFRIHRDSPSIPTGDYSWNEWHLRYVGDSSRMISANAVYIWGGLWTGTQRTINGTLSIKPSYRFRTAVGIQRTDASLDLPRVDFVTTIWTIRTNYSFTTNMFLDSLLQYDRDQDLFNANVRFNLIHRPLSDLFIVYNEQRFNTPEALAPGRGIIVKFTQMMSF